MIRYDKFEKAMQISSHYFILVKNLALQIRHLEKRLIKKLIFILIRLDNSEYFFEFLCNCFEFSL